MKIDYYCVENGGQGTYTKERLKWSRSNRVITRKYIKLEHDIAQYDLKDLKSMYAIKHLDKNTNLYELKFDKIRIVHFYWNGDTFVFLGTFLKKSQKTRSNEITKNNNRLKDYKERNNE